MLFLVSIIIYISLNKHFGDNPEASVNRFFSELIKMDFDTAVTYFTNGKEYRERFDFEDEYEKEIMKLVYPKLKYRIISSVINGNEARIEIQYQAISVYDMASWAISNILPGLYTAPYSNTLKPGAEKKMYEIILYYINNGYPPKNKGIMDINLVKDTNTDRWLIKPDDNLISMLNGDALEVFKYYDYIFSQDTTIYPVGKEVINNTAGITIEKVDRVSELTADKSKTENDLITVQIKIRNVSNKTIAYDSFDFKLQTSSGSIIEQVYNITTLTSGEIEPGQYASGTITYEAPGKIKDLRLLLINEPVVLARFKLY